MTSVPRDPSLPSLRRGEPHPDAALARSILACPTSVELVVDGFPHVGEDADLGLRDEGGTPTFWCRPGSLMARAAQSRSGAIITLSSGVGPPGSPDRDVRLTVTGRLTSQGTEACTCCGELRLDVTLDADFVMLTKDCERSAEPVRVPLRDFGAPALALNRGYLQRAVEHANDCHREDLGHVITQQTGTPAEALLDVSLTDLTAHGVELAWIDAEGGHRTSVWFSRPARTVEELGVLLRHELHSGIC